MVQRSISNEGYLERDSFFVLSLSYSEIINRQDMIKEKMNGF